MSPESCALAAAIWGCGGSEAIGEWSLLLSEVWMGGEAVGAWAPLAQLCFSGASAEATRAFGQCVKDTPG